MNTKTHSPDIIDITHATIHAWWSIPSLPTKQIIASWIEIIKKNYPALRSHKAMQGLVKWMLLQEHHGCIDLSTLCRWTKIYYSTVSIDERIITQRQQSRQLLQAWQEEAVPCPPELSMLHANIETLTRDKTIDPDQSNCHRKNWEKYQKDLEYIRKTILQSEEEE